MNDLDRLRAEYARRADDPRYRDWYSPFNRANTFIVQERDREVTKLVEQQATADIASWRVLDVGCGSGDELVKFTSFGIAPRNLFGIDLLGDRVQRAKGKYGNLQIIQGSATHLPYPSTTFDLVLQFTVFTSILDNGVRQSIADEMRRVLKPHGLVLWYDYRLNPTNPQTRGIEKAEIKKLFPDCGYVFHRITLAPPLARWIAPRSWIACALLNEFPFLKTHYLVSIRKKPHETRR